MSLANARGWAQVCDKQIQILQNLQSTFPQRQSALTRLSQQWSELKQQLNDGKVPRLAQ
ncbi:MULTISPECIES: hypothetical protein [Shewanella]|uniref:Uncharacterized protein n=2 Tax=Shewanella TaxID=22 RepID=A0A974XLW8_9GAMM|nr:MULTISPECIES: hypothetical protein [Shewanella]QSX30719.1 hypothetical protein JYB88_03390 [Shewanella cyperi]QSX37933.1 hypothetical protein JYB85_03570 [Shewanella sedimentimangrovi]QSX41497.1 hypothetical protein JYB84_03410 [Shewanella cyperi]